MEIEDPSKHPSTVLAENGRVLFVFASAAGSTLKVEIYRGRVSLKMTLFSHLIIFKAF